MSRVNKIFRFGLGFTLWQHAEFRRSLDEKITSFCEVERISIAWLERSEVRLVRGLP